MMRRIVLALISLFAVYVICPGQAQFKSIPVPEVSGLVNIGNDRVMVIADEGYDVRIVSSAAATFKAGDQNTFESNMTPAIASLTLRTRKDILDDIEDIAWDENEQAAFVITSHSRTKGGNDKAPRYKLALLQLKNGTIENMDVNLLRAELARKFPAFGKAMDRPTSDGGPLGAFNIEGLAFDPAKRSLLIGLRSPTEIQNGKPCAVIITLNNPYALFLKDPLASPDFNAQLACLDLGGLGIRGMTYDVERKGIWIVAGRSDDPAANTNPSPVPSSLWFWSPGKPNRLPQTIPIQSTGLSSVEAVCLLPMDGKKGLLLISDDGDEKENTISRYLWTPVPESAAAKEVNKGLRRVHTYSRRMKRRRR